MGTLGFSGMVSIEDRQDGWVQIEPPGGANPVWIPESAVIYLFTEEGSTVDLSKLK